MVNAHEARIAVLEKMIRESEVVQQRSALSMPPLPAPDHDGSEAVKVARKMVEDTMAEYVVPRSFLLLCFRLLGVPDFLFPQQSQLLLCICNMQASLCTQRAEITS